MFFLVFTPMNCKIGHGLLLLYEHYTIFSHSHVFLPVIVNSAAVILHDTQLLLRCCAVFTK